MQRRGGLAGRFGEPAGFKKGQLPTFLEVGADAPEKPVLESESLLRKRGIERLLFDRVNFKNDAAGVSDWHGHVMLHGHFTWQGIFLRDRLFFQKAGGAL